MAYFHITPGVPSLNLPPSRRGEVSFKVTSNVDRTVRIQASPLPDSGAKAEWLSIEGKAVRDLAPAEEQTFVVQVQVPEDVPEGEQHFRLLVANAARPDDEYDASSPVAFTIPAAPPPPLPEPPPPPRPFPWWIPATAGAVLILAVGGYVIGRAGRPPAPAERCDPAKGYCCAGSATAGCAAASGPAEKCDPGMACAPAASCAALLASRSGVPSGVYWLKPSTSDAAFQAYCDMTTEGGGWTLVWSNLRGGRGKPFTELQWKVAINTLPRYSGTPSENLESFIVYTGLKHWKALAPAGLLRDDWSPDYGAPIDQRYICPYVFSDSATYQITFDRSACSQRVGSIVPGLVSSSNNAKFSAYDVDNDTWESNCATTYSSGSPWWSYNCWAGSLVGAGEFSSNGSANGAFWAGPGTPAWGTAGGNGAGNGWIFVK